ncbi:charged multivesicular body protein 6-B [Planoprotostelium fungivorum]|uniref:Charged multivesicular body protein 6-B n=1 Tax=Planoprotostelium fungivorum TaxID=1890364 RepID=A0A2P6NIL3_9EUKA|nr:charged multivesicular body protein 6-B [Planoprotostelium fungivorum]
MGGLFSRSKDAPKKVTAHDRAVLDLKVQRDKLKQYKKKCEGMAERETKVAKELLAAGKKKEALLALKKKKYQLSLLEKTEGQLSNVGEMIDSIEFAQIEVKVFEGLKEGTKVLKELNDQMKIEDVEKLMEEAAEANETRQRIEEALSGKLTEDDEEEVLAELAKLEEEELNLPSVPNTDIGTTTPPRKEPDQAQRTQLAV